MPANRTPQVGTAVLDGLIQGPLPHDADGESRLEQWVEFVRSHGLRFHLSFDGADFHLLADGEPVQVAEHEILTEKIRQSIEQLLSVLPEESRSRVFSTVRCTEFRTDTKLQSLYALTRTGVQVQERTVAWEPKETTALPELKRPLVVGAAVVFVILVVSVFTVDYPALWRNFRAGIGSFDPDQVEIDLSSVSRYVTAKKIGMDKTGLQLQVEIKRGPSFPSDLSAFQKEEARIMSNGTLRDLVALRKVVIDGRLQVSYVDSEGKVLAVAEVSIRDLVDNKVVKLNLSIRSYPTATIVRFGF